jgi:hypothetical protein
MYNNKQRDLEKRQAAAMDGRDPYDSHLVMPLKEFVRLPEVAATVHNGATYQVAPPVWKYMPFGCKSNPFLEVAATVHDSATYQVVPPVCKSMPLGCKSTPSGCKSAPHTEVAATVHNGATYQVAPPVCKPTPLLEVAATVHDSATYQVANAPHLCASITHSCANLRKLNNEEEYADCFTYPISYHEDVLSIHFHSKHQTGSNRSNRTGFPHLPSAVTSAVDHS